MIPPDAPQETPAGGAPSAHAAFRPPPEGRTSKGARRGILAWLPWEKVLIWGMVLLAVYVLRNFFFVIFMTFIVSYSMRSIVKKVARTVWPRGESVWLERVLTVAGFGLLMWGLYEGGSYLGPRLYRQGETLIQRATAIEPQKEFKSILTKTLGAIQFHREYGNRSDPRYIEEFERFQAQGPFAVAYTRFPKLEEALEERFREEERQKARDEVKQRLIGRENDFEAWFLREKAPALIEQDSARLIAEWEKRYTDSLLFNPDAPSLEEFKERPEFEAARSAGISRMLVQDLSKDPRKREAYWNEWEAYMEGAALARLDRPEERDKRFRAFYERALREGLAGLPEGKPPYSYEQYTALLDAYRLGQAAFDTVLQGQGEQTEEERLERDHQAFEVQKTEALTTSTLEYLGKERLFLGLLDEARSIAGESFKSFADWLRRALLYLLSIPLQLALSLLLSFFITLDFFRIRRGVHRLKESRVREFYAEIAPGLYNFGRLIGRAFQAQGVIAIFNTVLTFLSIWYLGIQNEAFLCAIVFLCSFIPVLGVVLSSVPIAIVAIIQVPDGSGLLALKAIAAILVIHFIETSILNPKILGDMLHLHPVMVLAVLAIGEHFFGVWGLLLGVPVMVYIIRCVILDEEIPGLIEQDPLAVATGPPLLEEPEARLPPAQRPPARAREEEEARVPSAPGVEARD